MFTITSRLDIYKPLYSAIISLESAFPDYKIVQWNKNDIKDKEVFTSVEKNGYFDKKGNKKQQSELEDFDQKISEIKDYLTFPV